MILGFGALILFVRRPADLKKNASYVAVVLAILAAILILAFGLELESETTLTLLGAIAGYVLGNRKWNAEDTNEDEDKSVVDST